MSAWASGVAYGSPSHGGQGEAGAWPVLVCLLGRFRVFKNGRPQAVPAGKAEVLLSTLAVDGGLGVPRDALLLSLWPGGEPSLAGQSLNSLVYSLHRLLGDGLGGAAPVLQADGWYRLNAEAGVGVDVRCFEALAAAGDERANAGDLAAAHALYDRAANLYHGDFCAGADIRAVVEREHLRARYLTLLARLADYRFSLGDYACCLQYALRLLRCDPCREDAHRLAMRCYVRTGERAQALHQYRACVAILQTEFDAAPEPTTTALFQQVCDDPGSV